MAKMKGRGGRESVFVDVINLDKGRGGRDNQGSSTLQIPGAVSG